MSKNFNDMLTLFSNVAQGKSLVLEEPINAKEILQIAKKHSCFHMVALAIKQSDGLGLSQEYQEQLYSQLEKGYFLNLSRYVFCSNIFKEFSDNNIEYVCLKGYSVYPLYKNAFYRISSDIDLLVKEKDEKKAKKILSKYGFAMEKDRSEYTHHGALMHPMCGLLELHTKMFEDDVTNIWFASEKGALAIDSTPVEIDLENCKLFVLSPSAQILQLFFHLVKHFIEGGLSIRAMMDFVLAAQKYHKEIDFETVLTEIEKSGMKPIYDAVMSFMVEYCNVDKESLPEYTGVSKETLSLIYSDLETGAWIGMGNVNARAAMTEFAENKRENLNISGEQTIYKRGLKTKIRILFPHKYHLEKKYPCLKKHPYLYPGVIVVRTVKYILNPKKKHKKDNLAVVKAQNDAKRIEMFKEMGLM